MRFHLSPASSSSRGIDAAPLRRRRADAERNRAHVLDAARELFGQRGDEVQMDEVARHAGVGVGTLYRHFPTKEALVAAAAEQRFNEIQVAYKAARADLADELEALRLLLIHVGEAQTRDRGFSIVVETTLGSGDPQGGARAELEAELTALVRKGQASGVIRPDIDPADALAVTCGLATAIVRRPAGEWHHYVDIIIDGLRTH
jgi:AcrR family transcriptional regulator